MRTQCPNPPINPREGVRARCSKRSFRFVRVIVTISLRIDSVRDWRRDSKVDKRRQQQSVKVLCSSLLGNSRSFRVRLFSAEFHYRRSVPPSRLYLLGGGREVWGNVSWTRISWSIPLSRVPKQRQRLPGGLLRETRAQCTVSSRQWVPSSPPPSMSPTSQVGPDADQLECFSSVKLNGARKVSSRLCMSLFTIQNGNRCCRESGMLQSEGLSQIYHVKPPEGFGGVAAIDHSLTPTIITHNEMCSSQILKEI